MWYSGLLERFSGCYGNSTCEILKEMQQKGSNFSLLSSVFLDIISIFKQFGMVRTHLHSLQEGGSGSEGTRVGTETDGQHWGAVLWRRSLQQCGLHRGLSQETPHTSVGYFISFKSCNVIMCICS